MQVASFEVARTRVAILTGYIQCIYLYIDICMYLDVQIFCIQAVMRLVYHVHIYICIYIKHTYIYIYARGLRFTEGSLSRIV